MKHQVAPGSGHDHEEEAFEGRVRQKKHLLMWVIGLVVELLQLKGEKKAYLKPNLYIH